MMCSPTLKSESCMTNSARRDWLKDLTRNKPEIINSGKKHTRRVQEVGNRVREGKVKAVLQDLKIFSAICQVSQGIPGLLEPPRKVGTLSTILRSTSWPRFEGFETKLVINKPITCPSCNGSGYRQLCPDRNLYRLRRLGKSSSSPGPPAIHHGMPRVPGEKARRGNPALCAAATRSSRARKKIKVTNPQRRQRRFKS